MLAPIEMSFDFTILSSPAISRTDTAGSWSLALIAGRRDESGNKWIEAREYLPDGRCLSAPRSTPELPLAPGNQVGAADWNTDGVSPLVLVDLNGHLSGVPRPGRPFSAPWAVHPAHGSLCTPPRVVSIAEDGHARLLLLSRQLSVWPGTRNALGLLDRSGHAYAGYPIGLEEPPAPHPAVFDARHGRVFMVMTSGSVVGIDVRLARPLFGFPTPRPHTPPFQDRCSLVYHEAHDALLLATGSNHVIQVDTRTGATTPRFTRDGSRFSGVASGGGAVYLADEAKDVLLRVGSDGSVNAALDLRWLPQARLCSVQTTLLPSAGRLSPRPAIILVSRQETDPSILTERVFERHATPEIRQEIARLAAEEAGPINSASDGAPDRLRRSRHNTIMMKRGHLASILDAQDLERLLSRQVETRVQVIRDDIDHMEFIIDDSIPGHAPETEDFAPSTIAPAVHVDRSGLARHLVVPANRVSYPADFGRRSRLRVYDLTVGSN